MPQADPFAAYRRPAPPADDPFASYRRQAAPGQFASEEPVEEPPLAMYGGIADVARGFGKSLLNTVSKMGDVAGNLPTGSLDARGRPVTLRQAVDTLYGTPGLSKTAFREAEQVTEPTTTNQRIGGALEQVGEFLIPAGAAEKLAATVAAKAAPVFANAPRLVRAAVKAAPNVAAQSAAASGTAAVQGADPTTAAVLGAAGPVVGAAAAPASRYLGAKAEALVLSAVKPTVASLRRIAGASATGLEVQASKLARFILDTGATTPEKMRTILTKAEQELQRVLATKNAPTDAAERSIRYLKALENSAAKQGLPEADVATIRNAAAEVLKGEMGKDVVTAAPTLGADIVGANGLPIKIWQPKPTRVLRDDVMADEALTRARANSRWDTRKAWGEQKGAQLESSKAVERAQRDAVKAAVPEAAPILRRESQAIKAIEALDRMAQRTGNRDALSLPGAVVAAGEIAGGKVPVLGVVAHWLRNNQMKAGVWAEKLSKAIQNGDVQEATAIMNRIGVGAAAQTTRK